MRRCRSFKKEAKEGFLEEMIFEIGLKKKKRQHLATGRRRWVQGRRMENRGRKVGAHMRKGTGLSCWFWVGRVQKEKGHGVEAQGYCRVGSLIRPRSP